MRWQREAVSALSAYLKAGNHRALISAATGVGKGTAIAGLIVKAAWAEKRSLFVVHRDNLIDDVMARAIEVEPALHAGKVKGALNEIDCQCVFASVQSLHKKRLPTVGHFDFCFVDEAHRSVAPSYRALLKRLVEVNPAIRMIAWTATPFRSAAGGKTSGIGDEWPDLVYEYSLSDAITEGALCAMRGIRVETLLDLSGVDPDDEDKIAAIVNTTERNAIVVESYLAHAAGKPGICFGAGVQHARDLAAAFASAGVRAVAIWDANPVKAGKDKAHPAPDSNEGRIAAYRAGQIDVICNVDILSEGFDAPATAVVLLAAPTQSRGRYAQRVGRATRLHPSKTEGLVLDFVDASSTHSLATFADLTASVPKSRPKVGDAVRHRRDKALFEGFVLTLRGVLVSSGEKRPDPDTEPLMAEVAWTETDFFDPPVDGFSERSGAHPGDTAWHPDADLVLLKNRATPDDETRIVPTVIGVNEYAISLFGGRKIGWYTYDGSKGKTLVSKGKNGTSALIRKVTGGTWEAWQRNGDDVFVIMGGTFADCEASVVMDAEAVDLNWQRNPASEKQMAALAKWNIKRQNLARGEASMILEMKIILLLIAKKERNRRSWSESDRWMTA